MQKMITSPTPCTQLFLLGVAHLVPPSAVWADNSGIAYILSYDGYATKYGPTTAINYYIVGNGASTSNNIPITDISFSQARGIFW